MTNDQLLYYPNAGYGPQTLDFYTAVDGSIAATGAFAPSVQATDWKLWAYVDKSTMDQKIAGYTTRRVRQISVNVPPTGAQRYTAIWEAKAPFEQVLTRTDLSDAQWNTNWTQLVQNGQYGLLDHFVYRLNNTTYHAVSYASSAKSFVHAFGRTAAQVDALDQQQKAAGWHLYALSATEGVTGNAVTFSAIWRPLPAASTYMVDMSSGLFAIELLIKRGQGYHLVRSQGYDNGTRFLAVWSK
jgi:hypothetical protein